MLVALPAVWDLLLRAKYLFVAAIVAGCTRHSPRPLAEARDHCGCTMDMEHAQAVIADVCKLRGCFAQTRCVERTVSLLRRNWSAVAALASALVERRRIEGHEVMRIIT